MQINFEEWQEKIDQIPVLVKENNRLQKKIEKLEQLPGFKEYLSVRDIMSIVGVKERVARKILNEAGAGKIGNRLVVSRKEFNAYMEKHRGSSKDELDKKAKEYFERQAS